jgi:UTP-glucose-1-phosphate uridylyltransferase
VAGWSGLAAQSKIEDCYTRRRAGHPLPAGDQAKAGAQRLVIVTSTGKDCVAAHFASDPGVGAVEVPRSQVSAYGVFDIERLPEAGPDMLRVRGMVEKPDAARAPSTLAAAG